MLWTTDAAIALANGCQSSVSDLFLSDTPLTTAHSMPRSYAAALDLKIKCNYGHPIKISSEYFNVLVK